MNKITQTDIHIRMGPSKRLEVAAGLFDFTFEYLIANFKKQHPDYNQEEILELVRERISYGREKGVPKND